MKLIEMQNSDQLDSDVNETDWIVLTTSTEGVGYFNGILTYRDGYDVRRIDLKSSISEVRRLLENGDVIEGAVDINARRRWARTIERAL